MDDEWIREAYQERAAILEFCAGLERKEAERQARVMVRREMDDAVRSQD